MYIIWNQKFCKGNNMKCWIFVISLFIIIKFKEIKTTFVCIIMRLPQNFDCSVTLLLPSFLNGITYLTFLVLSIIIFIIMYFFFWKKSCLKGNNNQVLMWLLSVKMVIYLIKYFCERRKSMCTVYYLKHVGSLWHLYLSI